MRPSASPLSPRLAAEEERLRALRGGAGVSPTPREQERRRERRDRPGARGFAQRRYETVSACSLCHSNASVGKRPFHSICVFSAISFAPVAVKLAASNLAVSVDVVDQATGGPGHGDRDSAQRA